MGKLPKTPGGLEYALIATDFHTKWVEAQAFRSIKAADVKKFIWRNIICRFGIPMDIVTGNGTQFESRELKDFCSKYGIRQDLASVYYPREWSSRAYKPIHPVQFEEEIGSKKRNVGSIAPPCLIGVQNHQKNSYR